MMPWVQEICEALRDGLPFVDQSRKERLESNNIRLGTKAPSLLAFLTFF